MVVIAEEYVGAIRVLYFDAGKPFKENEGEVEVVTVGRESMDEFLEDGVAMGMIFKVSDLEKFLEVRNVAVNIPCKEEVPSLWQFDDVPFAVWVLEVGLGCALEQRNGPLCASSGDAFQGLILLEPTLSLERVFQKSL